MERWYYKVRSVRDPVGVLKRQVRADKGKQHLSDELRDELRQQHEDHASWAYKLHRDNLIVTAEQKKLGPVPSCATVRRFMHASGLFKQRRRGKGGSRAERRHASHESRSYEVAYVHGLGHLDFHECSRALVTPRGPCSDSCPGLRSAARARRPRSCSGVDLCPLYPLDRQKNADGRRAALQPVEPEGSPPPSGMAPLLKKLMTDDAASGCRPPTRRCRSVRT